MFEKIVLRRSDKGPALTVGELAEALLFYQNVHLVLDYASLNAFIENIRMEGLLSVLARPNVSAVYCEETLGTHTERVGIFESHSFAAMTFVGTEDIGHLKSRQKRLEFTLQRHGYDKRKATKLVEQFRRLVPIRKLTSDHFLPGGIIKAATEDIHDPSFVQEAMRRVLHHTVGAPDLLGEFSFEIISTASSFHIFTNLDFNTLNLTRKKLDPSLGDVTPAHLINELLMARADTMLAAHYGGEFYTSDLSSQIVRLRHGELLRRAGIHVKELEEFKEIVLPDSPSIRMAIDSRERSFDEFLKLLDKSQRFRNWIQKVNPDEKLVHAYLRDVTAEGWINTLPGKTLRYVLGSFISIAAPKVGFVVSAIESLLLEKIFRGWRPSHFITQRLKPFLNKDDDKC